MVAARAEPVTVQGSTDVTAIGEGYKGGPVPGLHDCTVEAIEVHLVLPIPNRKPQLRQLFPLSRPVDVMEVHLVLPIPMGTPQIRTRRVSINHPSPKTCAVRIHTIQENGRKGVERKREGGRKEREGKDGGRKRDNGRKGIKHRTLQPCSTCVWNIKQ